MVIEPDETLLRLGRDSVSGKLRVGLIGEKSP